MYICTAFMYMCTTLCVCIFPQLHSRCESVAVKDVPEILHTLRVLAKFLGHLDFLPYSSILSPSLLPARTASVRPLLHVHCITSPMSLSLHYSTQHANSHRPCTGWNEPLSQIVQYGQLIPIPFKPCSA